jgi:hypothetical protein
MHLFNNFQRYFYFAPSRDLEIASLVTYISGVSSATSRRSEGLTDDLASVDAVVLVPMNFPALSVRMV